MRLIGAFAVLIALFGAVTPAQAQGMPQCGQVVTVEFTLMGDWGCGNGPALIVGANGVKINLNGHTLSGNPAINMTDVDGTTISNGTIVNSPVVAVNATNTRFVDAGISWLSSAGVYDWPGTTVTFVRSNLQVWRLFCGERCHLLDSTGGLNQIGATHLILEGRGSNINFIGAITAEVIDHSLRAYTIGGAEQLTIRDSEMPGAEIIAPKRLDLLNNTFSGGMQLGVHKPVNGVISGNRFENMRASGLVVRPQETLSGPLLIENNTFAGNRADGLRIDVPIPLDITVRNNTSENNGQYGMWATAGTVTDGGGNVSNNDVLGCFTITC